VDRKPIGAIMPAPDDKAILPWTARRARPSFAVIPCSKSMSPTRATRRTSRGRRKAPAAVVASAWCFLATACWSLARWWPTRLTFELELAETGTKLPAKVVGVDYEANLALLEAATNGDRSKSFFAGLKPMGIEAKAKVGDNLNIWQLGRVGDLIVTQLRLGKVLTSQYVVEGSRFLIYEGQGIVRSEGNSFTVPIVKGASSPVCC